MSRHIYDTVGAVTHVGGPTMGADMIAHAVVTRPTRGNTQWFSVRKIGHGHGLNRLIEGGWLERGSRVALVDDVLSTGASLMAAYEAVVDTGASVSLVAPMVDRGVAGLRAFGPLALYRPLFTYEDLGLEPL